ncbi:deoxyguanosinetriphosphate triphosphohydrolase family protein [Terrisporobacter glycolicus]|uniref:Deoxyguanosinetriphosphate triphosphohydrolase-like protein n=1 Tax=Terrisporobacter glycolicus ATCC 14880 = DSM 1288 TaxID=1121315 RepID=A0ABZ2EU56_9FIRM|nr:dNTP triphosphohydrolase [Terrisporobacter glycolicus]
MKTQELNIKYEDIKSKQIFRANEKEVERSIEPVPTHPIRNNFQRDRDRILYSRAFRRLSGKTQVFTTSNDDHIRTRLTHTLEVSQIARTISKELGLDEDLTEAIALGHDLGHTPFGHVGERTLNQIMNGCYKISDFNENILDENKGFKHNLQGIRVVNELEEEPLNLTKETIWGIVNHSSKKYKKCLDLKKDDFVNCNLKHKNSKHDNCGYNLSLQYYDNYLNKLEHDKFWTIEGLVVALADEIAQRHHDIEDAIEFNILSIRDIYDEISKRFSEILKKYEYTNQRYSLDELENEDNKYKAIAKFSKFIVDFLTTDLINQTKANLIEMKGKFNIGSNSDFYNSRKKISNLPIENKEKEKSYILSIVSFSQDVKAADEEFQRFLKNRILKSFEAQRMDGVGSYIITKLFEAYTHNPQQLRDKTIDKLFKNIHDKKSDLKQIFNDDMDKGEKEFIGNVLDSFEKVKNTGDKRDFISDLHYKIMKHGFTIEDIYKNALMRTICDYISGMTDNFAIKDHKSLYNK